MALALTGISLQLPSSGHRPSIRLERYAVRPGHQSQRRLRPLSLPATACISLQLPASRHHPSIPLARHLLCPGHLSPRHPRPLSISLAATPASAFSSASAIPPLTSRSGHNNQSLYELLDPDGSGRDGGSSGGRAAGGHDGDCNRTAALMVPPRDDWPLVDPETDEDDQDAILPGSVGLSSSELQKFPLLRQLEGLKQRLLADDVFLAKVAIECGLGIFSKAMAVVADFMLVHLLPAPTASLTPALLAKFFHGCPGNAFQIALPGSSYSPAQRLGAIALNGGKNFAVGLASSMVRTAVKNVLINARNVTGKSSGVEVENVPILSAGVAYGFYMAISHNVRSQVLDGVIEQRILEPLLHQHKLVLSAVRFAVRTENTFLDSLMWTHYARLIEIQK